MSKIDEKLGEVIDKLTKLAETHGGHAVDMAASVVQVNALGDLVAGGVFLSLLTITAFVARYSSRKAKWTTTNHHWGTKEFDPDRWGVATMLCAIPALLFTIGALADLARVWSWVALFNPKLALAKQIMKAAGL